jgi:hypothetical protein
MKWIALKESEELRDRDIVTRTIRRAGGTNQLDVTLGYPRWSASNNGVIARMPIQHFTDKPEGWRSEYRGDDPPKVSGWHLVSLIWRHNQQKPLGGGVAVMFYDAKINEWFAEPTEKEIIAYMPLPKPYQS